jgi:hypothetical protein
MADADSSPTTSEWRPPAIDLGMICTCDAPAAQAMRDVIGRYHLDETVLVSDLMGVLRTKFGVSEFRIGVDQWFGIRFRIGATNPPAWGVVAADEVEHALVAILRHLDGTAPVPQDLDG